MKRLLKSWNKSLRESFEEPSEYEELLASIEPGLVFVSKQNPEEQMMIHPDGDHFIDSEDEPIKFDSIPTYNFILKNYEPVSYEFLDRKWHQILSDYEVVYPFSIENIWNEKKTFMNTYSDNSMGKKIFHKRWNAKENIVLSYVIYISQIDFSIEKDGGSFQRKYQVSWVNFDVAYSLEVQLKKSGE